MKRIAQIMMVAAVGMLAVTACNNKKNTTQTVTPAPKGSGGFTEVKREAEFASIRRTPCYGRCPEYTITIYPNGKVEYLGVRFVDKVGKFSATVTPDVLESVKAKAKELGYFEMEDVYKSEVSDFPTCITSITIDGKTKRVVNESAGPENLATFEKFLDETFLNLRWLSAEQATPQE